MPTNNNNKTDKKHRNTVKNKKRKYNFSKGKTYTGKGTVGEKIAKAVTPTSFADVLPLGGKAVKGAKAAYKYLTS